MAADEAFREPDESAREHEDGARGGGSGGGGGGCCFAALHLMRAGRSCLSRGFDDGDDDGDGNDGDDDENLVGMIEHSAAAPSFCPCVSLRDRGTEN